MDNIKQKVIFTFIITCLFCSPFFLSAQDDSNKEFKANVGLGATVLNLTIFDYELISPTNYIYVTINPAKNFRIEPGIGFFFNIDPDDASNSNTQAYVSLGQFGVIHKNDFNIIIGARFDIQIYDKDVTAMSFAPTIAGEYLFSKHFSLGLDIGFVYAKYNDVYRDFDPWTGYTYRDAKFFFINTNPLLRFYF